jgi:hypothetical protein
MSCIECTTSTYNLGLTGAIKGFDKVLYPVFVPRYKQDGTRNNIVSTATLDQAYWDARFKNEAAVERWQPVIGIKNFVREESEDINDTFEDGTYIKVADGQSTITMVLPVADPYKLEKKLEALNCKEVDLYLVDVCGNIGGQASGVNLNGAKIQKGSISARPMGKNDTQTNKLEITFVLEKESATRNFDFISAGSLTSYDLTTVNGLMDVSVKTITATATTLVADLILDYGGMADRLPARGLAANLRVYNVTGSAAVTSTIVESTTVPGRYTATFTTPGTSQELRYEGLGGTTVQLFYDLVRVPLTTDSTPA